MREPFFSERTAARFLALVVLSALCMLFFLAFIKR